MLQVSQPQMHNVLKGHRRLQLGLADELLRKLSITILDLLSVPDQIYLLNEGGQIRPEQPTHYVKVLANKYTEGISFASRKPPASEPTPRPVRRQAG